MVTPLLTTKLHAPRPRPELVPRLRLIERLNEGLHRKLTLISAPAGFGKTTLISTWGQSLEKAADNEQRTTKVAWLSLDENENDPIVFLTYFIAALNKSNLLDIPAGEAALSMLHSPQPLAIDEILTSLINEIAESPHRIIYILDDYHLMVAQPIHEALIFLLEHLPTQMHLVIAARQDPPLPLARMRAKDELTELRAADLRFTPSESAVFLNHVMGLALTADDLAALESRTEGWIAGLQLAAISMQGREDATTFIQSFKGSHHFVLDYLIEEVLDKQTETVQAFLLKTAILDRFTEALCDALTGQNNGQITLEELEHANLFIIPLDDERRWYRYHHLFADLLRARLRQLQPESVANLHIQASMWFEENGLLNEAIEYALRAGDFENAAHLMIEITDVLWGQGEHRKLKSWFAKLPNEWVTAKPQLCVYHAWYLFAGGHTNEAEQVLHIVDQAIGPDVDRGREAPPDEHAHSIDPEKKKLRGRAAAIRALMASYSGDVPGIIHHANQALDDLPINDHTMRIIVAMALGDAQSFQGDMAAAYQAYLLGLEVAKAARYVYFILVVSMKLALIRREQGHLQQVIEICQQQWHRVQDYKLSKAAGIGWLLAVWGETLAELNELDEALGKAMQGVALVENSGDLAMLSWAYLCLIRVYFSRSELAQAEKIVKKMEEATRDPMATPSWGRSQATLWQVRIWLVRGEQSLISEWVRDRGLEVDGSAISSHTLDYFTLIEYVVYARILFRQGRLQEALNLLEHLLEAAEAGERHSVMIEILMLQAKAFQANDDIDQALTLLEQALTLAESGGFIRTFVDEGPDMARLIYEAVRRKTAPEYAHHLLAAFSDPDAVSVDAAQTHSSEFELIEPLSERELEVLDLMALGLTNQEIGTRLFLSLNTVKVHARNIYGKLGVNNRTQAVTKAQGLGILK